MKQEPDPGSHGSRIMGSRNRIFEDKLRMAKLSLNSARSAAREADAKIAAAECDVWSARMEGFGGPAEPSPTIQQALGCGYFFLEVKCRRCLHRGAVDLRLLRRYPQTQIWRLEPSLTCEECKARRYGVQVYMIKLSKQPDTSTPWYAPDELDGH
jgi:hypothetical protein